MKILILSNGHGEDVIAVRIVEQLRAYSPKLDLAALPLVGEGTAYSRLNVPIIGRVQSLPSGGFIYMDGSQLWNDLRGGLLRLTLEQYRAVRQWSKHNSSQSLVLAVGDLVPLLFAWLSGANYAFVGTAKSEYYLRSETGWLSQTSTLERWFGSVYLPWERWLMSRPRCQAVFPRDKLTTEVLKQWSIPAYDLGNPMMDGLDNKHDSLEPLNKKVVYIALLPGSRMLEAQRNWQQIMMAVAGIINAFEDKELVFLAAIAPGLSLASATECLQTLKWHPTSPIPQNTIQDGSAIAYRQENATLLITQNAYAECLQRADAAIAMAGTATEQFVGLGKPVFTFPGTGPQFTYAFAEAQTRLLGCSVILVEQPGQVAQAMKEVLEDSNRLKEIAVNGKRRMGTAGAGARIASFLLSVNKSDSYITN